jgi:hypothetical protein
MANGKKGMPVTRNSLRTKFNRFLNKIIALDGTRKVILYLRWMRFKSMIMIWLRKKSKVKQGKKQDLDHMEFQSLT